MSRPVGVPFMDPLSPLRLALGTSPVIVTRAGSLLRLDVFFLEGLAACMT